MHWSKQQNEAFNSSCFRAPSSVVVIEAEMGSGLVIQRHLLTHISSTGLDVLDFLFDGHGCKFNQTETVATNKSGFAAEHDVRRVVGLRSVRLGSTSSGAQIENRMYDGTRAACPTIW